MGFEASWENEWRHQSDSIHLTPTSCMFQRSGAAVWLQYYKNNLKRLAIVTIFVLFSCLIVFFKCMNCPLSLVLVFTEMYSTLPSCTSSSHCLSRTLWMMNKTYTCNTFLFIQSPKDYALSSSYSHSVPTTLVHLSLSESQWHNYTCFIY